MTKYLLGSVDVSSHAQPKPEVLGLGAAAQEDSCLSSFRNDDTEALALALRVVRKAAF